MKCFRGSFDVVHVVFHSTGAEYLSHCGVYFQKCKSPSSDVPTCIECVVLQSVYGDMFE